MKKSLLLILGLLLTTSLFAGPVGKEEAKAKALAFLNGTVSQRAGVAKAPRRLQDLSLASSGDAYHVFNIGASNGFVIVSGSDLTPDIIGYTDEGAFDAQNIPDNMKAWLQEYANQIAWVEKNGEQVTESKVRKAPATSTVKSAIAPLIQTKWMQTAPYNGMVPSGCVTGCVATAMAQVLYYCNQKEGFPLGTTNVIPEYNDGNDHTVGPCSVTTFEWANMQLSYSSSSTDEQKKAVAKLMLYCGASVNMSYGSTSSATTMYVAEALNNYFGFDHHLKNVYRDQYTAMEWDDLIYQELASARPVLCGGKSTGGGHAFICDGYDVDGYFHINWGWGGTGDGYYLLSVLNPNSTGVGAGSSRDGYTMNLDAIIGFQQSTGDTTPEEVLLTLRGFSYTGAVSVANTETYYPIEFKIDAKANLTFTHTIDLALGFYDEEDNLVGTSQLFYINCSPSGFFAADEDLKFNFTQLTTGKTYKVVPICRERTTTPWHKCIGADKFYLTAVTGSTHTNLSTNNPTVNLSTADVKLTTDGVVNTLQTITAKVTNNSSDDYKGNIYLYDHSGNKIASYGLYLETGESIIAPFSFIPTTTFVAKTWTIKTDASTIGSGSITIKSALTGSDTPVLSFATVMNTIDDGGTEKFLGKKAKAVVTATNNDGSNYDGWVSLVLWYDDYSKSLYEFKKVFVLAGGTTDIEFEYDLDPSKSYRAQVQYYNSGNPTSAGFVTTNPCPVAEAITSMAADGTETETLATDTYTVPAGAVVVDMRELSTIPTTINENDNPNCLYLFASSATVPTSLSDNNVVKGTTAANVELTDGYDFYTPIDFTATNISYTRRFTTGADGSGKGWNTIMLPFDVQTVKRVDTDTAIDWFKSSSDTGKNFWVYQFVIDGKGAVNFDRASDIKANTPYLITVPSDASDAWDAEFDLTGKDITFAATDVTVKANEKKTQSGFYYMFTGGSQKQTVAADAGYVLNAEGNKFAKTTGSVDVPAFQAYFYPSTHNLQADALAISFVDNSEATDIQGVDTKQVAADDDNWYTLQGVKLDGKPTEKGIYIYNGKKVAIK